MPSYVYFKSEKPQTINGEYYPGLWTVGYYDPSGEWMSESDHNSPEEAAVRVNYLNGGDDRLQKVVDHCQEMNKKISQNHLLTIQLQKGSEDFNTVLTQHSLSSQLGVYRQILKIIAE